MVSNDYYKVPTLTSISKVTMVASVFPRANVSIMIDGGMCLFYANKTNNKNILIDCYNDGEVILASWITSEKGHTSYKDATRELTHNLSEELKTLRRWFDDK
jgi:hypothetical protein